MKKTNTRSEKKCVGVPHPATLSGLAQHLDIVPPLKKHPGATPVLSSLKKKKKKKKKINFIEAFQLYDSSPVSQNYMLD